jgi:hypothetical protein
MGVPRNHSGWTAYAQVAGALARPERLQRQPRTSPVRAVKRRRAGLRWLRSVLLGTTTSFASIHAAAGAERIHIDFNGYRAATNDYLHRG